MDFLKKMRDVFSSTNTLSYEQIESDEIAPLKEDFLWIDVREKEEWDEGHIDSAYFFPLTGFNPLAIEPLVKGVDKKIVFYCRSGGRSSHAALLFLEEYPEYKGKVFNLKGGILSFSKNYANFIQRKKEELLH